MIEANRGSACRGSSKPSSNRCSMTVPSSPAHSGSVLARYDGVEVLNSLSPPRSRSVHFSDSSIDIVSLEEHCTYYDACSGENDPERDPSLSPLQPRRGRRSPPQPRTHLAFLGHANRRRRVRRLLAEDRTHHRHQQQCLDDSTSSHCSQHGSLSHTSHH
jgi:hypothetical protein